MKILALKGRSGAILVLAAALVATACNEYYIPPPPVSVILTNFTPNLVITTVNSNNQLVPNTLQLNGAVENSPNPTVIYSVGQFGNYIQGGSSALGFISPSGVYTAPNVVPNPNTITILAAAQADPTQTATTTITLLNQPANPTTMAPSVVTTGGTYTFQLAGNYFAPGATANFSGALVKSVNIVSPQQATVTATITAPGLLSFSLVNPVSAGDTNAIYIRSQPSSPAASSTVAVIEGLVRANGGATTSATKAYIPKASTVAVVNLDANLQTASIPMPNGYAATFAAAHPAADQVVIASASSNIVQILDSDHDQLITSYTLPVNTTATVDGAACEVCGLMVDSARHLAILDTAVGYFTLNLDNGTTSTPIAAPPAANFAYDPTTERVYAPFNGPGGSGVNVVDLGQSTVSLIQPGQGEIFGTGTDAAAYDPATALLTVGDKDTGALLGLNFNSATSSGGAVQVPATTYSITSACPGVWNAMTLDFTSHLGWFANLGGCVAVATLPAAPSTGVPGAISGVKWAELPAGPDGLDWQNTAVGAPHTLAVYLGVDGRAYGLALRQDGAMLLKMDLNLLQSANAVPNGADVNQVDPQNVTVNTQQVSAMTYIPLR